MCIVPKRYRSDIPNTIDTIPMMSPMRAISFWLMRFVAKARALGGVEIGRTIQRREVAEWNARHCLLGESRTVEGISKGKSSCHHPDYRPVDFLQVAAVDYSSKREYHKRHKGYCIRIDARNAIQEPERHGEYKCHNHNLCLEVVFQFAFYLDPQCRNLLMADSISTVW